MKTIQLLNVTPEELQAIVSDSVEKHIDSLKEHFQPKKPSEYLSRKEVAGMLKINISTVHNWVRSKKLKAYSIGNRIYFKRAEVEESIIHINE